jgi:[calcium/calmodulin-dependent protein kinase] kinase
MAGPKPIVTTHKDPLKAFRSAEDVQQSACDPPSAASDGVYTPKSSPARPEFHSEVNSPYTDAPKETNIVEIDFDPLSGHKIINDYEILGELGRGNHGKVKLGRSLTTGKSVAIKIIERVSKKKRLGRTGDQETKIKREIAILKKARHPNIVGLLEVIDDPAMKKVYIILEHVELGEVKWRTKGELEISLVEYRRCNRESEGVFDEAAELEDHMIIETARRQRQQSVAPASRDESPYIRSWSLEHGQSSSEDLRKANGAPAATDVRDFVNPAPAAEMFLRPESNPHSTPQRSDNLHTDEYHTAEEGTDPNGTDPGSQSYDGFQLQNNWDSFISVRSEGFEAERVPENYRYVPLLTLGECRRAIRDTVLGLEYLHYQGVIHRDIKPANLLLTKDHRVKISDFGVSYLGRTVEDEDKAEPDYLCQDFDPAIELAKTVGTPAFYAPELCQTDEDRDPAPVTGQIDVWALGVTLYCLVYGRTPYYDGNTFVLMRRIAEQSVYIPRRRLKAVSLEETPVLPHPELSAAHYRQPHDMEYEEITDELHDLLRKLLTKDPRQRMKLIEVKHHPWLLDDIQDPSQWIAEWDPSRITQGKKIEVSKEDVEHAVHVNRLDQVRIFTQRIFTQTIGRLGGKTQRRRAKSSATAEGQLSSNASSSSNISAEIKYQESRRPSLKPDELVSMALRQSRDAEHPLSYSVTASPEIRESPVFAYHAEPVERPHGEREISGTGSVRTIRPSDHTDWPGPALGAIFGGALSKSVEAVDPDPKDDPHTEPSLAVSNAVGEGLVWPPAALQGSKPASRPVSRPASAAGLMFKDGPFKDAKDGHVRCASIGSHLSQKEKRRSHPTAYLPVSGTSAERLAHSKEEFIRRLIHDDAQRQPGDPGPNVFSPSDAPRSPDLVLARHSMTAPVHSPSDDQIAAAMSQSTSNRSLPSAFSAGSSVGMDSLTYGGESVKYSPISPQSYSNNSAAKLAAAAGTDDEGYAGDACDSGDESDSSFVEMRSNRAKKALSLPPVRRPAARVAASEDDELTM